MTSIKKLLLRFACQVCLLIGAERLKRWWHSDEVLVLVYHNIGGTDLSEQSFRRQIEYLRAHYSIISLEQLMARLNDQKQEGAKPNLPKNSVIITFDDGQAGIRKHALPVLQKFNIPASVFLTTGLVGTDHALPMDRFDAWAAKEISHGEVTLAGITAKSKIELGQLRAKVKTMDFSTLNIPKARADTNTRILNLKEIGYLQRHNVTFYPHGHSHLILANLGEVRIRSEVATSQEFCRTHRLGTLAFAYPNGNKSDFTHETEKIVAALGVKHSFSMIPGYISTLSTQPGPLPRLSMGETEEFTSFRIRLTFGLFA